MNNYYERDDPTYSGAEVTREREKGYKQGLKDGTKKSAEHDREVAEKAWDEGYTAHQRDTLGKRPGQTFVMTENPHALSDDVVPGRSES